MIRILVDTSFLISFADRSRPHHDAALSWFRHCVEHSIPMELSTLVAAEFEVGQPVTDLPLRNFHVLPFNLPHARMAAGFLKSLRGGVIQRDGDDGRAAVVNDLKILGQAEEEGIGFLLTEDENTLAKYCRRLREAGLCKVSVLLLKDGFSPGRLATPDQNEFNYGDASAPEEERN